MKIFKKVCAAALAVLMLLSLCACHSKDEVAVTIEGSDIKSALYLNALIDCDSEAKSRVDEEEAAAKEKENEKENASSEESTTTEETDYYSKTLDGLSYVEYVKSKAIERCKEFVFYQKLADEGTIKLTDEELSEADYYAQTYWNSYGYSMLYETNGVSYETYKKAFTYSYYSNAYFKLLYGKGGEKEVPQKDIKDNMLENYTLAYALTASYEENATDDQKAALKTKLQGYETRLKKGEDYLKLYNELNNVTEEQKQEHNHEENADGPKDEHATILADKNSTSSYANADFDTVYDLKVGETVIIENEAKTGLTLYMKLDINSDEYYLTHLTDAILYELKDKEFDEYVSTKTKDYKVEENSFAIKRFDVEKIDYSVLENAYASANATAQ